MDEPRVLVTGAGGQLGHDVALELERRGCAHVFAPRSAELDITDAGAVRSYFKAYSPDVVIHCAAYTAVDRAEEERLECCRVNALGTLNVARASAERSAELIYVSTDYVFDGKKRGAYRPTDERHPLSVYGTTKAAGEDFVRAIVEKHFIVRTSWVFGANGGNFVKTMLRLAESRHEISVVNDQLGAPTYTRDLAPLLCDMAESKRYGTYHAANAGVCSWYGFACEIFRLTGADVKVVPISSSEYPTKAVRPANSVFDQSKLKENGFDDLPEWKDALRRFLKEIGK